MNKERDRDAEESVLRPAIIALSAFVVLVAFTLLWFDWKGLVIEIISFVFIVETMVAMNRVALLGLSLVIRELARKLEDEEQD